MSVTKSDHDARPVVHLSEAELKRMRRRAYVRSGQAKIDRDRAEAEKECRREERDEMGRAREAVDRIVEDAQRAMAEIPTEKRFVSGPLGIVTCNECGLMYCYDDPEDVRLHKTRHRRFLLLSGFRAEPRFGDLLWEYRRREDEKRAGHDAIGSVDELALEDRLDAMERVAYAWYCRAIIARFERRPKEAPTFGEYCAMISESIRDVFDYAPAVVSMFVAKYGSRLGIIKRRYTELPEGWKGSANA